MTRGTRGPLVDRRDDCYETPPAAVKALLRVETLPEVIWECACGPGAIVHELREVGHKVYATDLVDYGCPDSDSRIDFLMERHPGFHVGAIVTNPPFKLAANRHARADARRSPGLPAAAARILRKPIALCSSRVPPTRPYPRLPQTIAHDASRRLEGPAPQHIARLACMVLLGPAPLRRHCHRSHLMGTRGLKVKHLESNYINTIALSLNEDVYSANGDLDDFEIKERLIATDYAYAGTGLVPIGHPKLQKELSRSVVLLLIDELKTLDAPLTM
jgi:hypothetical protein